MFTKDEIRALRDCVFVSIQNYKRMKESVMYTLPDDKEFLSILDDKIQTLEGMSERISRASLDGVISSRDSKKI